MTAQRCKGEGASCRLARQVRGGAASMLPGAMFLLLPKCPLCLAAWLTVVTGVGVPAAFAAGLRGTIVALWIAGVTIAVARIVRARTGRDSWMGRRRYRAPAQTLRCLERICKHLSTSRSKCGNKLRASTS